MDLMADLHRMAEDAKKAPPPTIIIARWDVPVGGKYRYYDTRGRRIQFLNRLELELLSKNTVNYGDLKIRVYVAGDLAPLLGIPVIYE